jgi:hypothetical protein
MHVATIRVDIWWMTLMTATEKHISAHAVSLNSRSANPAKTLVEACHHYNHQAVLVTSTAVIIVIIII